MSIPASYRYVEKTFDTNDNQIVKRLLLSSLVWVVWYTYEKLLLIEPSRNNTKPVIIHAAWNNILGPKSGKLNGMITYPNNGIAPKDAKEQNITNPWWGVWMTMITLTATTRNKKKWVQPSYTIYYHPRNETNAIDHIVFVTTYPPSYFLANDSLRGLVILIPVAS